MVTRSRKRIETKQFCGKENVYWRIFKPVSSYDLSPGSGMLHWFLITETNREQRIYEKQHVGILLLNIPWHLTLQLVYVAVSKEAYPCTEKTYSEIIGQIQDYGPFSTKMRISQNPKSWQTHLLPPQRTSSINETICHWTDRRVHLKRT